MTEGRDGASSTSEIPEPPYLWATLAALFAFALYVVTLAPTTAFWDASEYIATAHILGIPHPPGNPLFVVVGRVWSLLLSPLGLSVAVRVNLLAAATSAASTGLLYLVAHRTLHGLPEARASSPRARARFALVGAGVAALPGFTAFTVWNQSNVNEKVYTLSVLVIALVVWLGIRWRDTRDRPGSERLLLWAVLALALGSTNHLMSVLAAPALAVLVLLSGARPLLRPAFLGRAALLVVLGLSFNFFLPVRSALEPVINEGHPTCDSALDAAVAIYSLGRAGCPMLADNLTRRQYQPVPVTERKAPFAAQLEMYWQYFEWQWARGLEASELPYGPRLPVALVFLALGVGGLVGAWRADRVTGVSLTVLAATLTVGLVYYLNFRYGYSLAPHIEDPAQHEVRERDYFFIAGFLLWGWLAGLGLAWLWRTLAGPEGARFLRASPVLAAAFVPLVLNWSWATRAGDWAARDWAWNLLMSVEPYGVLFTNGDNDTFPLWYLQEVEGIRRDVTVIVGQYLYTTWYPRQLQRLTSPEHQRPFEPALSPPFHEERPPPSGSILAFAPESLDRVAAARLTEDLTIAFPELAVTYPSGILLDRSHQLALSVIHESVADRPIYFSSRGGMLTDLGLERWGLRQGLVTRLVLRPLGEEPLDGAVRLPPAMGDEWFDVERSIALWEDVYRFRGFVDRPIWADRSTLNIPWTFYATARQLAEATRLAGGDEERVGRLEARSEDFAALARGGARGTP